MITIDVNVYGGVSPTPIRVIIENLNDSKSFKFTSALSFIQNFDLPKGEYMLTVTGVNPKNADSYTEINLSGEFLSGPLYNGHREVNTPLYSEIFYFEI